MAKAKEVNVSVIEKARRALDKVPPKQPDTKPVADALEELKPTIEAAIAKGYTRAEVADLLKEHGLEVKDYHLKALLKKQRAAPAAQQ